MFCSNCGTQNPDSTGFCSNCGAALTPVAASSGTSVPPVAPAPSIAPVVALPQQKTNVLCIVGFFGSLGSIILLGATSFIFLIISIIGLISASARNEKGRAQAIAGIIISAVLVAAWIIGIIVGIAQANT